jgi:hypothetical protein
MRFRSICHIGITVLLAWISIGGAEASTQTTTPSRNDAGKTQQSRPRRGPPDPYPGPKTRWLPCGVGQGAKVVRQFFRAESRFPAAHFGAGKATLACGSKAWGYWHILERHLSQWQYVAIFDGVNWREAADWGMWNALKFPSTTIYSAKNDTWAYRTTIYLKNKKTKETVKKADVVVVVANKTKNIITAYPTAVKDY